MDQCAGASPTAASLPVWDEEEQCSLAWKAVARRSLLLFHGCSSGRISDSAPPDAWTSSRSRRLVPRSCSSSIFRSQYGAARPRASWCKRRGRRHGRATTCDEPCDVQSLTPSAQRPREPSAAPASAHTTARIAALAARHTADRFPESSPDVVRRHPMGIGLPYVGSRGHWPGVQGLLSGEPQSGRAR
jgi:hypothetical protein